MDCDADVTSTVYGSKLSMGLANPLGHAHNTSCRLEDGKQSLFGMHILHLHTQESLEKGYTVSLAFPWSLVQVGGVHTQKVHGKTSVRVTPVLCPLKDVTSWTVMVASYHTQYVDGTSTRINCTK